jgi:UDP-N-acetylglucosamine transferase subunit ALG13
VSTFVTVGNPTQAFCRLLDAVAEVQSELPTPITVQHGSTPFSATGCIAREYVDREEFAELLAKSSIFIAHAGAGCILEAIRAGKLPIVMARLRKHREHIDDHQLQLTEALESEGRVIVISSAADLRAAIPVALQRQQNPAPTVTEPPLVGMVRDVLRAAQDRLRARRR